MLPTVAIIGRPNVGKSTLFNRLVGKRLAIVDDTPGVTRDRREGEARLGDLRFLAVDTAGLEDVKGERLEARMRAQTEAAIAGADLCLFVIDARAGVTPLDRHFADLLRKEPAKVLLVANKCEGSASDAGLYDAFALGLGEPIAVSAEHGEGMGDLYAALETGLESVHAPAGRVEDVAEDEPDELGPDRPLRIAVVGRPNAGKSTLINTLIGQDRMLTGPEAGITRDSIAVMWNWEDRPVKLYDTAGLRRKSRVVEKIEKLSTSDTLRAVRFAEVVILLIDSQTPFEKQDLSIADLVIREGRALVIGYNKWDLVEDKQAAHRDAIEMVDRLLPQVRGVPLVPLSGEHGRGVEALMNSAFDVYDLWNKRVPTAGLNRWLEGAQSRHPAPAVSGRRVRIRYVTQVKSRPPTFAAFTTRADELPDSYTRYMINSIRETFDIPAVPIRFFWRERKNPYVKDD